jgi:uncharacterized protein
VKGALALAAVLGLLAVAVRAAEPDLPRPDGFVTDRAGVLGTATRTRLERLLEELRARTGAEIAILTVPTTAPFDDFTYALRVAEAWRPGRKGEDTGVLFLLAVDDRKLRMLVGYGLEGVLPDGLVGEIQDTEVVPALRAGDYDQAVLGGTLALASRIAADRGVALTGVPPPRRAPEVGLPAWVIVVALLALVLLMLYQARHGPPRLRRSRGGFGVPYPGPLDFGGGGFGGGGGGFGGFGGGGFGGGGAGRSW